MGEKVQGIRSINGRYKIGEIKNSKGNVETKEFICRTHGHELKGRGCGWEGVCRVEGNKGGKMEQL